MDFIVTQAVKRHLPIPEKIADAPERFPWLDLHWDCFRALCRDRPRGGFIPWMSMFTWARAHGVEGEEFNQLERIVGRLDVAYVDWIRHHAPKGQGDG